MNLDNRLKGKIAFITGCSSGIGESCAKSLAKLGVNLVISARRKNLLNDLKVEIEKEYDVKIYCLEMDVRNYEDVKIKIENIPEEFKNINILINNAGLSKGLEKAYKNSVEEIDSMIDTNIKGMLYVSKAIIPNMIKLNKNANIINIGSIAGDSAYSGGTIYCATKAAVKTLSDGMRIDLLNTPIKVTDVKPGMVETNFSNIRFDGDTEKAKSVYKGIVPLYAEDIAETITYICNLPDNVQIPEITITPTYQADPHNLYRPNN